MLDIWDLGTRGLQIDWMRSLHELYLSLIPTQVRLTYRCGWTQRWRMSQTSSTFLKRPRRMPSERRWLRNVATSVSSSASVNLSWWASIQCSSTLVLVCTRLPKMLESACWSVGVLTLACRKENSSCLFVCLSGGTETTSGTGTAYHLSRSALIWGWFAPLIWVVGYPSFPLPPPHAFLSKCIPWS